MLTLQELSDRAEIGDIVARLGYTQDDKDFDGLAALFADRIGFDMSAAGGDPATDITRDDLADLARTVLSGFTATQHRACNVLTTVDGDSAHCRAMVHAWHTVPTDPGIADFYTARNNWLLRLERVDGRWLITRWTIVKAAPSDGYQGPLPRCPGKGPRRTRHSNHPHLARCRCPGTGISMIRPGMTSRT